MVENKFTEEELPRGMMMLIGRSMDGKELACMVKVDTLQPSFQALAECLGFNDSVKNVAENADS